MADEKCCRWLCSRRGIGCIWRPIYCCNCYGVDYEQFTDNNATSTNEHEKEIERLNKIISEIHERNQENEQRMQRLTDTNADLTSRLSKLMGDKLKKDNTGITDLNDQNRPMKISDLFQELYDNEWTDAFSELQKLTKDDSGNHFTEKESIQILLDILQEVNKICCVIIENQLSGIREVLTKTEGDDSTEYLKLMRESLKKQASHFIPVLLKMVPEETESVYKTIQTYQRQCRPFIEKCITICYLAAVQNPPMYFDFKPGEYHDKTIFKDFTNSGSKVDFLVWPALRISKEDGILSKGVVQPVPET